MKQQSEGRVGLYGWDKDERRYVVVRQTENGFEDAIQGLLAPFIGRQVIVTVEAITDQINRGIQEANKTLEPMGAKALPVKPEDVTIE